MAVTNQDIERLEDFIKKHRHEADLSSKLTQYLSLHSNEFTQGEIFYIDVNKRVQRLAVGTNRFHLQTGGSGANPLWVASLQSLMTAQGDIVYASGANTPTRLATGTVLQFLQTAGASANPVWATPSLIASSSSDVTVQNTTTETDILSETVTGGTLSTGNAIRATIYISDLDIISLDTLTIRLDYGGVTAASFVVANDSGGDLTNLQAEITAILMASGATNSQDATLKFLASSNSIGGGNVGHAVNVGSSSGDSTGDLTMAVTAQWSAANGANRLFMSNYILEKII